MNNDATTPGRNPAGTALRPHQRLTVEQRQELDRDIIDRYLNQLQPIQQIARSVGRSYGSVHRALTEHQIPRRPRGGNRRAGTVRRQPLAAERPPAPAE